MTPARKNILAIILFLLVIVSGIATTPLFFVIFAFGGLYFPLIITLASFVCGVIAYARFVTTKKSIFLQVLVAIELILGATFLLVLLTVN